MIKVSPKIIKSAKDLNKKAGSPLPKIVTSSPFARKESPATIKLGEILFGLLDPKNIQIETQKHLETAQKSSAEIAKQAKDVLSKVKNLFQFYLKESHLDDGTIIFSARPKSEPGAAKKAQNATLEKCNELAKTITKSQNIKLRINEILPKKPKNASQIFQEMYSETKILLEKNSQKGTLSLQKIQEIINPKTFEKKYGQQGANFAKKILKRTESIFAKKANTRFNSIESKQKKINAFVSNKDEISSYIKDAVGVRFVIKKPEGDINNLPMPERVRAFEQYMSNQINQLTDMLFKFCKETNTKMKNILLFGGNNRYLKEGNIQKLKSLDGCEVFEKNRSTGYISTQGRLEMNLDNKTPIKVEFQIRSEEVDKFAEVEHWRYKFNEDSPIDLTKYNQEQKTLIEKGKKESKRIEKDKALTDAYDKYIAKCYSYCFAKDYGVDLPVPKLPEGINDVLSRENLLKLTISKPQKTS